MAPMRLAKFESAIRAALEFRDAFNRRDPAAIGQLLADDCVLEMANPAPDSARYSGKEAVIRFWQAFFARWPNVRMDVEEVFGFGERAVLRPRYAWADPAGSQAHLRGADIFRVSGNAIREHLTYARR